MFGEELGFRQLEVWQEGKSLVVDIYRLSEALPKSEDFGLKSQLRRAAVSIPCNIAEGYGRKTPANYAQFLRIAKGSPNEIETLLELCSELGYLEQPTLLLARIAKLGSKLTNLINSISATTIREEIGEYEP